MAKYQGTKTLEVLEGADNYNKWIASTLKPYVGAPALEVGAGTGNISEYFTDIHELVLSDTDVHLVKKLSARFKAYKNITVEALDITAQFSKVKSRFKTIFAINVLEHIDDDIAALRNMRALLEDGGNIVLLVPAKKFAFTSLDKNLGHYRRYEKKELVDKVTKAGFTVRSVSFFNIVGLLSWLIRDKVSRDDMNLKASHIKIFNVIVPFLQMIEPKKRLPIGISLVIVAHKN